MHNSARLRCFENGNDDFGVEAFWIGDATRVGYFVPLNGPLNGHPPSNSLGGPITHPIFSTMTPDMANPKFDKESQIDGPARIKLVTGRPVGTQLGSHSWTPPHLGHQFWGQSIDSPFYLDHIWYFSWI